MSSSISGLHYEENQVGGTFKSSKIEYVWEFILNGSSPNKIQLIYSKWTDDKKLIDRCMNRIKNNHIWYRSLQQKKRRFLFKKF